MAHAGETIVIGAPPEAVFALYERYDRHPEWQQELVGADITTPGPVGAGTQGVEVRRMLGREVRTPYEITEHDPPRRSAFRTFGGPIRFVGAATFAPVDGGTRMTFAVDVLAPLPLRPVAWLLARRVARGLPGHLDRFKGLAEAQSTASAARA
jgi:uncharacterized protein YndB with AHSA1/START domain